MIDGMDELNAKLERMISSSDGMMKKAAERGIKRVQAAAKMLCPVNAGELRNSIRTSTQRTEEGWQAICYTNKSYAAYVEFGTGPVGQQNHRGISPAVNPVYSQRGWAFPASEVPFEKYNFAEREYNGQTYYLTNGQPAQPFMYPALKDHEDEAMESMIKAIKKAINEVVND